MPQVKGALDAVATMLMIVASIAMIVAAVGSRTGPAAASRPVPPARPAVVVPTEAVPLANSATLGQESAAVIVMIFSDFECPYCRRFVTDGFPKFKAEFLDTGKAQFIFRHLPLDIHPTAFLAAQSAECARRQNRFWPMHDELFARPKEIPLTMQLIGGFATKVGIESEEFEACVNKSLASADIKRDEDLAARLGITGTPTFLVGRREGSALRAVSIHRGMQTPERLGAAVRAAMAPK